MESAGKAGGDECFTERTIRRRTIRAIDSINFGGYGCGWFWALFSEDSCHTEFMPGAATVDAEWNVPASPGAIFSPRVESF